MKYVKDIPRGLFILAISVILFTIYYHIRPFLWGADISIYTPMIELTPWGFVIWINIILEIVGIYAVTIGFYKAKNWARLFTIAMFMHSSFWTLYFLFIEKVWPYERYTWLIYYIIVIVYLMMSDIREYFGVKKMFI
jgi:hypothetical protein